MKIIRSLNFDTDSPASVALGTFDGVHLGHRAVIRTAVEIASAEGLTPAVFTFSDLPRNAFLPMEKRVWPLCSFREKAELIEALGAELLISPPFDRAISAMPPESFVREVLIDRLHARHIVCGFDHRFGAGGRGDAELLMDICRRESVAVTIIPPVTHGGRRISSTEIRHLMERGCIEDARALLGHKI